MTDTVERSDEPIVLREGAVEKPRADSPLLTMRQSYVPPLDGSADDLAQFDTWIALQVAKVLTKHYYGYDWHVKADSRQGVVAFSIPSLMGPTLHMVIRLAEYKDLEPRLIMRKAGELLERMNLPRSAVDIPEYYAAIQRRHTFDFGDSLKRKTA